MTKYLCPKCGALLDYVNVVLKEENLYRLWGGSIYDYMGCLGKEVSRVECPNCYAVFKDYDPEDFEVEFKKGKIVPKGDYWKEHEKESKELILKVTF